MPSPAAISSAPEPQLTKPPSPTASHGATAPASEGSGTLTLVIVPPSEVTLDGKSLGTVSHGDVQVSSGRHVLRILHSDYKPLQRVLNVTPGGRPRVVIDLAEKGIRKTRDEVR
jgi:hypothetical protein